MIMIRRGEESRVAERSSNDTHCRGGKAERTRQTFGATECNECRRQLWQAEAGRRAGSNRHGRASTWNARRRRACACGVECRTRGGTGKLKVKSGGEGSDDAGAGVAPAPILRH